MRIDAHQHFWDVKRGDYGWLTPDLKPLYQNFQPHHLAPLLFDTQVDGTVLVQAAPTIAETYYLLELADGHDFIKAVVGWVDFDGDSVLEDLAKLKAFPKLKGVRPMIQDIEDPDWMLAERLTPIFNALVQHSMTFDALVLPVHLKDLLILQKRHPDLRMVIDHGATPDIASGDFYNWAADISRLAEETECFCKVSGLWTEAGGNTEIDRIKLYVDHLLAVFGPKRLIWGSDWPVLSLAGEYTDWHQQCVQLFDHLSSEDKAAIFGLNAEKFYALGE